MTHLSPAELKSWYEHGRTDDRPRVIAHLAECAECRKALSVLAMSASETAAAPAVVTAAEAAPRGYKALPAPGGGAGWSAWLRPAYGLAGAAAIVLAVLWLANPRPAITDSAVRSSELLALRPSGSTAAVTFEWESPFNAARYRITVRDTKGTIVAAWEAQASPSVMETNLAGQLASGQAYVWQVTALDAANEVIAESRPTTFSKP
jgi:hypothetical protein